MMAQTEIAVVGAGPAGMNAAIAAAELGVDVTLIDGYDRAGGQYYQQLPVEFKAAALRQVRQAPIDRLRERQGQVAEALFDRLRRPEITHLSNTRVWDIDSSLRLALHGPGAPAQLQAEAVILATGAFDRPAAFPGWTLPGVMSVGGAQTLVKAQRVLPGRKILLAGSGPLLLALGALLVWAGAEVVAVLEGSQGLTSFKPGRMATLWGQGARLKEGLDYLRALRGAGVAYRQGWGIVRAVGGDRVEGALLAKLDDKWRPVPGSEQKMACDTICIGYGFIPETALGRLAGAEHSFQPGLGGWVPLRDETMQTTVPGLYAVGDGAGIGGAVQSAVEGRVAGMAAAYQVARDYFAEDDLAKWLVPERKALRGEGRFQKLIGELFTPGPGLDELADEATIICRCVAVKLTAVQEAVQMGAETVGAVKGLTRAGMGECQGRICGPLLAGQVARLCGKDREAVGCFSPRPPVQPADIRDLAGGAKRDELKTYPTEDSRRLAQPSDIRDLAGGTKRDKLKAYPTYDALVIGAGYIGSAISYYLSKAGLKTALIDQGGPAAGASRANYGNIQVQDAELDHSLPMILAGRATFETLEEELDHDVGLRSIGSLLIAESESQVANLQARAIRLAEYGIGVDWLSPGELQRLEPNLDAGQTYGALYSAHEMQLDPFKLVWAFVHRARQKGLHLQLYSQVEDFIVRNGRVRGVVTAQGKIESDVTILATGAWSAVLGEKLGLNIPVMHVHGQAAATGYVGDLLHSYISSAAFFEAAHEDGDEVGDSEPQAVMAIAPTAHGNLLIGEAAQVVDHFSKATSAAGLRAISQTAQRFIPALRQVRQAHCGQAQGARILRTWAAPVAFTADGRPFLGPVDGLEGLLLAVAFKSTVVITPLIGQVITQLVMEGRSELDIRPFLLSRIGG